MSQRDLVFVTKRRISQRRSIYVRLSLEVSYRLQVSFHTFVGLFSHICTSLFTRLFSLYTCQACGDAPTQFPRVITAQVCASADGDMAGTNVS